MTIISCGEPDERHPDCIGRDRWDVKTLTDVAAQDVNYKPTFTTISTLVSASPEMKIEATTPRFGIEFKTYTVRCHIREYKLSDDGDDHLVLTDLVNPSVTMIAEIPDAYCESVRHSMRIDEIVKARDAFKKSLLNSGEVDTSVYTITGVAFFDKAHGQLGAARNAIELHPILSISK